MNNTALLLIDIQNDYFPGGAMELSDSTASASNAGTLLSCFRERKLPVFFIRHVSVRPGATFFLPGTRGTGFYETVIPVEGEPVITKHFPNSFRETTLHEQIREIGVSSLVIAGMMTHMCIDTTVRAASDRGYHVTVASDACATRDLAYGGRVITADCVQQAFLAAINGTFAEIFGTDEIVRILPENPGDT